MTSKEPAETGAEALLRAARGDHAPTALERASVRRALEQRLMQAPGSPGSQGAGLRVMAPSAKLWLLALCSSLAALGVFVALQKSASEARHPDRPQAAASPRAVVGSQSSHKEQPLVRVEPEAAGRDRLETGTRARPRTELRRPRRDHSSAPAPMMPPLAAEAVPAAELLPNSDGDRGSGVHETPDSTPSSATPVVRAQRASAERRRSAADQPAPAAEPEPAAPSELELMQRVQLALRDGNPRLALALSIEHAQRWPHGAFNEEREGARAIAECELDTPRALAAARAFLTRFPGSALAPRVRSACSLAVTNNAVPRHAAH